MAIIEVSNLTKEYRVNERKEGLRGAMLNLLKPKYTTKKAVDLIDFSIEEGDVVGYIGANGAGKSTTIKMLTGVLTPTSGSVTVNGLVPHKNRAKNNIQIGAVFGQRSQLWWDLPVIESYNLIQKIYEVPRGRYLENLERFKALLDLKELLKIPVRQLSLGQKMRCEIAAAFIHDPRVVYLDEPTIGLDVMVKEKIRTFIKDLNREKRTTIILTTHDLQDIEDVSNRVIIIDGGRLIFDGSLSQVKSQFGKYNIVNFKIRDVKKDLREKLGDQDRLSVLSLDSQSLSIRFERQAMTAVDVMQVVSQHCSIYDLSIQEPSIESIVKDLYKKEEQHETLG